MHQITKRSEICIDINIEISEADHYTWIFISKIFRLALETTFLLNKYFFLQVAYEHTSYSHKENLKSEEGRVLIRTEGGGGLENVLKK